MKAAGQGRRPAERRTCPTTCRPAAGGQPGQLCPHLCR